MSKKFINVFSELFNEIYLVHELFKYYARDITLSHIDMSDSGYKILYSKVPIQIAGATSRTKKLKINELGILQIINSDSGYLIVKVLDVNHDSSRYTLGIYRLNGSRLIPSGVIKYRSFNEEIKLCKLPGLVYEYISELVKC